jgi:hypothetical protein
MDELAAKLVPPPNSAMAFLRERIMLISLSTISQ